MRWALALLAVGIGVAGCGGGRGDTAYLDRRKGFEGPPVQGLDVADVPVNGSTVVIVPRDGPAAEGELLVAGPETVTILATDGVVRHFPWPNIVEVRLRIAASRRGEPAVSIVWTAVGSVSTISHGFFLVLTLPMWLGAGIPVSIAHGRSIRARVPPEEVRATLHQFARFPAGLPAGWDKH